ncbi:MAG: hypothetical protein H7263_10670 [Candidatus Sericytochromatia bacterium]|nr:hypothetical protein [Candidatus Sericytochromatia bacterium]
MNFNHYPKLIEQANIKIAILSYADLYTKVKFWLDYHNLNEIILLCDTSAKKLFIYLKTSPPQYMNLNSELKLINVPNYELHPVIDCESLNNIYFDKKYSLGDFLISLKNKTYYHYFLENNLDIDLKLNNEPLNKI